MVRTALLLGLAVLLVVGIGLGSVWLLQRRMIYFPDAAAVPPAGSVLPGAREVTLRTTDGLELGAWFVPPTGRDREQVVLVAPGNAGNRAGRAGLARSLRERGFAVLLLDYRGYGGNPGRPSEQGLARDADAAVATLVDLGYPASRTLYLGESLGTGVVAGLVTRHPPAGALLRSPFPSLSDLGSVHYPWLPVGLLLRDRFPVAGPLARSEVPVTVVYGDRDGVVPPGLSARVADRAGNLAEELVLPGTDHNDPAMFGSPVADAVVRLGDRVAAR